MLDEHTLEYRGRIFVALDADRIVGGSRQLQEDAFEPFTTPQPSVKPLEHLQPFSTEWWLYIVCALSCVVSAAFAAGLTMGLVALDPMQLQITLHMDVDDCSSLKDREELERDQAAAHCVYPIIENHHLLLVTLLLVNAGANEALPIFLDALLPSWAAILVSVTGVLIFGEIIPSAIFTGPNQLRIAAALSPLVYGLIAVASPIAYPLACLLDRVLGDSHSETQFKRQELRAIMKMATEDITRGAPLPQALRVHNASPRSSGGRQHDVRAQPSHRPSVLVSQTEDGHQEVSAALSDDELCIINGVLDIRNKRAKHAMIGLGETFMLSTEDVLDSEMMAKIVAVGHSRIPVYRHWPHNVCGIILVKKLIVLSPDDRRKISSLGLRYPLPILPEMPLLELLNLFQRGMSHLAIVTNKPALVAECMRNGRDIPPDVHMDGIVTLEDILENIIAEGITDETDDGVAQLLTSAAKRRARIGKIKLLAESMRQPLTAGALVGVRAARATTATAISDGLVRRSNVANALAEASAAGVLAAASVEAGKFRNRAAILSSLSRQGSCAAMGSVHTDSGTSPPPVGSPSRGALPAHVGLHSTLQAVSSSLHQPPPPHMEPAAAGKQGRSLKDTAAEVAARAHGSAAAGSRSGSTTKTRSALHEPLLEAAERGDMSSHLETRSPPRRGPSH